MRHACIVIVAALLGGCAHDRQPPSPYDAAFEAVMARYDLPGLALGVIENGKVVYVRTAGERRAGSGDEIDPDTLFKIASNSKAMTASLLARQVDAGKLRWDDPVVEHLPQFRMHDPWVGANIQVSDLLVHNSGLPAGAGDLMLWPTPNSFTREDIIAGLAHLKPKYAFRSRYAYDNLLYVVAGEVAAAIGGASYEELVRREVFEPLGLGCRVGEWRLHEGDNVAQPHMRIDGRNVVAREDGELVTAVTSAAAGGIRCSLNDMLVWARNWLVPDAKQLAWLSRTQRGALWTPRTPMPVSRHRREWYNTHFNAYGYGFRLADVDGHWTVSHTGTLVGMYSEMMLLPDEGSGFVMMTNGAGGQARTVLGAALLKHFTAPEQARTVEWFAAELAGDAESPGGGDATVEAAPRIAASPNANGLHTGVWRDAWFGEISICVEEDVVRFRAAKSPRLTGTVIRIDDRYLVDWDDDSVDAEPWLEFSETGAAKSLTMSKVDPRADFSFDYEDLAFTRNRDCPERSGHPD
jgi:CubicO group peptidase (beta-lactamase class C family)